ncbi:hypothetical protein MTO96_010499 [Rhipicephalus appendiculatus]
MGGCQGQGSRAKRRLYDGTTGSATQQRSAADDGGLSARAWRGQALRAQIEGSSGGGSASCMGPWLAGAAAALQQMRRRVRPSLSLLSGNWDDGR